VIYCCGVGPNNRNNRNDELEREIRDSTVVVPFDFVRKSIESVFSRLQKYVKISRGGHFEI
jgi:precorrin-3B methylase